MTLIKFTVPGEPIAQPRQRHRIVSIRGKQIVQNYTPARHPVNEYKRHIRAAFRAAARRKLKVGKSNAVVLTITAYFPRPEAICWRTKLMPKRRHNSKPDWDNVGKAVSDALEGLAYDNDSRISDAHVYTRICAGHEEPRTEITIEVVPLVETNGEQQETLFETQP